MPDRADASTFFNRRPQGRPTGRPGAEGIADAAWTVGFWLAALALYGTGLGNVPLRDWDEGIVAQVARELWEGGMAGWAWLYPTLQGEPYFNKPPLVHWAIALSYQVGGVSEWTARLPGALLAAAAVPLLYGVGRALFRRRFPAIAAAAVYLTWLPVARHGRLAMLDGAVLCFALAALFCLLRSRRDLRWALGFGAALGAIALTKSILALLVGAIGLAFLAWDTPRLLRSPYLWGGLLLGLLPAGAWYAAQGARYGDAFLGAGLVSQALRRVWAPVSDRGGPPWYYLFELLKYGWPWLLFVPAGLALAWRDRAWGWAKLTLVWAIAYGGAISVMGTKLPWYLLPLYPALALAAGAALAEVWDGQRIGGFGRLPARPYPRTWIGGLGLLAAAAIAGTGYLALGAEPRDGLLAVAAGTLAAALAIATGLAIAARPQWLPVTLWGSFLALLLFFNTGQWLWELNEQYPVKPVAALLRAAVPPGTTVYTAYPLLRPSLDFYCRCRVVPTPLEELQLRWEQDPDARLLLDEAARSRLGIDPRRGLGTAEGLTLFEPSPFPPGLQAARPGAQSASPRAIGPSPLPSSSPQTSYSNPE